MKYLISMTTLLGLILVNSTVFAAGASTTYGPVITIKPKGVQSAPAESRPAPGASTKVKQAQKPKPTGLILPAVQKAQSGPKEVTPGKEGTAIQGGLDRDIIRRTVPSKPKPKP